ncbi:MAG: M14 family metallopeptidase [Planctomycetota bacterium]|jgi:hypothetical protein
MIHAITLSITLLAAAPADDGAPLLTVAEASEFEETATHEQVMELLDRLAARSQTMRLAELGRSHEDRVLPLAIFADPPVESAAAARDSGKAIVFAFGNIHAGEVCGKEALLMLARELALDPEHPWLENLVVVLAPIYNADGNQPMSPDNRPGQVGPREMGVRANAQGFDLNRDWVKLEAPETRAMVRFLTEWDPHITIDTHTTNGSQHRYTLTYETPLNSSTHPAINDFLREDLLPAVTESLREGTGYESFYYGNFNREHTTWTTYSAQPRFGGPYRGLRGQMSILSEAYSYATFRDRVLCTAAFLREILDYAAAHRDEVIDIHERVRAETIAAGANPQPDDIVGIRHRPAAFADPVIVLGWETGARPGADQDPDLVPRDYPVVHRGRFEPTKSVRRPHAYLIPPGHLEAIGVLRQHGIEPAPWSGEALVEVYEITRARKAERPFQGHRQVRLDCAAKLDRRALPDGSFIVSTASPLGTLIVYLLEPESEDGLATWNVFDDSIRVGGEFPVYRVRAAADLSAASSP